MNNYLDELVSRYPELKPCYSNIEEAIECISEIYSNNCKLLIAGNGGSAADAEHIVGELMKSFKKKRILNQQFAENLIKTDNTLGKELSIKLQGSLPAIALANHNALNTAFLNDVDGEMGFAQQTNGYGNSGDLFLGITTSGNSKNIIFAAITAKAKGLKVIALTGGDGGKLKDYADVSIIVPEQETYLIQELHLPIYHCICLEIEERFYGE